MEILLITLGKDVQDFGTIKIMFDDKNGTTPYSGSGSVGNRTIAALERDHAVWPDSQTKLHVIFRG